MFLCSLEQKCSSSLFLVLTDLEAGCLLEPLLGDLHLCLQGKFEDYLMFPNLFLIQEIPHDLDDIQIEYKAHELFLLYDQDATLLV